MTIERLREALQHALTFIENRFSDLSPEKRATVAHIREALSQPVSGDVTEGACTCGEVCGEDPNCVLHGRSTVWGLENAGIDGARP